MKKIIYSLMIATGFALVSCDKDAILDTTSQTILSDDQIWQDPKQVLNVLANLYDRMPKHTSFTDGQIEFSTYDEAIWSGIGNSGEEARNNLVNYPYDRWRLWDYTYIRDINVAIDNITAATSTQMTPALKAQFLGELRFLRAKDYFEMVKRMGGVPIVTTQLIYDFSGDATPLRQPRNKEYEVYDFVASECDAIKNDLGNASSKTRINKYAALALKSRAMLYAASIAKYNNLPGFTNASLPGGEVGIPAAKATEYYQKSLDASKEILASGVYSLYKKNAANLGENFWEALTAKSANPEVILATDYSRTLNKRHNWTLNNIAKSLSEQGGQAGSNLSPTLNLAESFDYLNGDNGALKGVGNGSNTAAGQTAWVFYNNPQDIFANKDARLYGTLMYPGSSFNGKALSFQAGIYVWNATTNKYDRQEGSLNSTTRINNVTYQLTGDDGPHRTTTFVSNTGFYIRKYIDAQTGASATTLQSDTWWVLFRLGEIYLNASEAAFELGLVPEATGYMNTLRERAGFPANSLATLTLAKIQNERRVELAFEDHRVWDLKRWRIADKVWDGTTTSTTANMYALYPYLIVRPGHVNDGKYVFDKIIAPRFKAPRFFRPGNYYSSINQSVIDNNPLIVRNPFH